jgi:hypothetical protein
MRENTSLVRGLCCHKRPSGLQLLIGLVVLFNALCRSVDVESFKYYRFRGYIGVYSY